jgi:hypothetical protein
MTIGTGHAETTTHEEPIPHFTPAVFQRTVRPGFTPSGIVRILPTLQVDVRMAHSVVDSTMT